jgi:hypothetical protein
MIFECRADAYLHVLPEWMTRPGAVLARTPNEGAMGHLGDICGDISGDADAL